MRKPVENDPSPATDAPDRPGRTTHSGTGEDSPTLNPLLDADSETDEGSPLAIAAAEEAALGDARLVELARRGDHAAFGALVRRYERKLIRVLARLVRDPELARDLAQETFWRVYNRLDRFDTARRFGPWLFRIGVNLGLDHLRRCRSEPPPPASIDRGFGEARFDLPDPDPRVQAELAQEVQFILAQIPASYRTILVLRDLEGFSSSEVAAIVGRREATIRWRLSRAREKFRQIWERRRDAAKESATDG